MASMVLSGQRLLETMWKTQGIEWTFDAETGVILKFDYAEVHYGSHFLSSIFERIGYSLEIADFFDSGSTLGCLELPF